MPDIADAFPSRFLRPADLHGREWRLTIAKVTIEPVGQRRERKPVLYFAGKPKGLILNKTNALAIAAIAGSPLTERWPGVVITIYPTTTTFGKDTVACVRVKAPPTAALARRPAPEPVPTRAGVEPPPAKRPTSTGRTRSYRKRPLIAPAVPRVSRSQVWRELAPPVPVHPALKPEDDSPF